SFSLDSANKSEHENLGPQEEPAPFNPLLRACLTGDTEGVQQIFEDLEDPDHEKANRLLMEKDIVGRGLLYATCMAGQSDVIRTLARYGVDLKDKTARGYTLLHCAAAWGQLETLKTLIELEADIYATTSRGEKARDIACRYEQTECVAFLDWTIILDRSKSDWLENTKEATMQDFLEQKQLLEDIMLPIFTKLATPREYQSPTTKWKYFSLYFYFGESFLWRKLCRCTTEYLPWKPCTFHRM
uniref:Ankyrin repeat domain 45 n=1 Tax=Podarcis muralis TaxID=64176 RepID=A0A670HT68_PODMU